MEDAAISSTETAILIYRSLRLDHGQGRILIERWTLCDEPRLCNITRRDGEGRLIWRAALPDSPGRECFIAMRRVGDAVLATTYQGVEVLLDMATGMHLPLRSPATLVV